jgi:hypothetical protein
LQVISGENWNDVMYVSYEAIGTQAVVFLVAVYVIGNMLLMNLFIAILIDTFVQQTVSMRLVGLTLAQRSSLTLAMTGAAPHLYHVHLPLHRRRSRHATKICVRHHS